MDAAPIWVSLKTTLVATAITFVFGILAARWRYGCKHPAASIVDAFLLLPLALPPTVIGLILLLLFGRHSPVGEILSIFGITIIFSWQATVITAVAASFPLMYLTAHAAFQQIEPELLDVGRIYGLSEWRLLWRVMIFAAWPGILAATILSFVRALGEFGATLMLAGNLPGRTQTIPLAIFSNIESGDTSPAIVLSLIAITISLTALLIIRLPSFLPLLLPNKNH